MVWFAVWAFTVRSGHVRLREAATARLAAVRSSKTSRKPMQRQAERLPEAGDGTALTERSYNGGERGRPKHVFCETNPPFLTGFLLQVAMNTCVVQEMRERNRWVSFWKTNPPERVLGVVFGGKWGRFRRRSPLPQTRAAWNRRLL